MTTSESDAQSGQVEAESPEKKVPPVQRIIRMLLNGGAEFFHATDGHPFVSLSINGHPETLWIGLPEFRDWLARLFYCEVNAVPSSSTLNQAISVLTGIAKFASPQRSIFVRVGGYHENVYVDLANEGRQAVEINSDGWRIISDPPVKFRRPRGMLELPQPLTNGSLNPLRALLNIGNDDQWVLVVSWLLAALRPSGPYPILVLEGSHGSAKSTATRLLRHIIDPNAAPSRSGPENIRDLMISAFNGWCQTFDNLSHIPAWLSDAFCRLATGGGFATRELYSNEAERLFEATRPVLMNGIDVNITRGDLLDRTLMLSLPTIAPTERLTESRFWRRAEEIRPVVLGGLFTAMSGALRRMHEVRLAELPRMADFAIWVTAAESTLGWDEGTMLAAYNRNRRTSSELALEASPLVPVLENLVDQGPWAGTATELFSKLSEMTSYVAVTTRGWPGNPRDLSASLRRLAPNLRDAGIDVQFDKTSGSRSRKTISLSKLRAE